MKEVAVEILRDVCRSRERRNPSRISVPNDDDEYARRRTVDLRTDAYPVW